MREYTPDYESFRDDAVAVINASAVVVALMGTWTKPVYMGPIALLVAAVGYLLAPRSRGGTILAVCLITLFALLETWLRGGHLA